MAELLKTIWLETKFCCARICKCLRVRTMMCNPSAQPKIEVSVGQDGRVRIIVPARGAGEQPRIISMKVGTKNVELVTQEQELTAIAHSDPSRCDESWIGGEGNGTALLVGSLQRRDVDC